MDVDSQSVSWTCDGEYQKISIDEEIKKYYRPKFFLIAEGASPNLDVSYTHVAQRFENKRKSFRICFRKVNYGNRAWFECPRCYRRARYLYLHMREIYDHWKCGKCIGRQYPSQCQHRNWFYEYIDRPITKMAKVEEKMNKKGIRKSTKEKLQKQLMEIKYEKKEKLRQYSFKKGRHFLR